ncbi:6-methylsalicylic acid decarboxylase [Psilocybe cubensis]|uniref:6-methylsalicylic acid decarboxylase n=2 Tax=Psilocybe cubensis TaxID=181762 RepID=A0ACB8H4C4_PSICU|nr:6-methylsalicylic acid decarboxylase [Psilocybe cubensis]KAH9482721.1 6-methylsalicylic acid decarboxylase [Psilocybe cubensis]
MLGSLLTSVQPSQNFCVDIHHHYFTPDLKKDNPNPSIGWKTPAENLPWSPEISLQAMDKMKINVSILSFPSLSTGSVGEENRSMARTKNEYASELCREYPERFMFFATLPFLDDVEGCLEEIAYAIDQLNACGVSLSSCYGEGQSASDKRYDAVWEELNRRQAVVFVHGSQIPGSTPCPHSSLGVPITEVPNETFKAASHLVVTGHPRKFPNVKVVLAHLGGSTPMLAARVAVLSNHMGCELTPEEILEDFKKFYYETALSGYEGSLAAVDKFIPQDHILFGTDFPGNGQNIYVI